ncbi:MAG: hypothetical protein WC516_07450 [Patescibacteria group bacterium]
MAKNKKIVFLTVGAVAVLLLAGCGAPKKATNSNSQPKLATTTAIAGKSYDPCDLLTKDDVAMIFPGGDIKLTRHDITANVVGQKICFYSASETDQKFAQLSIVSSADMAETVKSGGENAERLFSETRDTFSSTTPLSGLGDDAYYGGSGLNIIAGLYVLDQAKGVSINVTVGLGLGNTDQKKHMDIEEALAKKILSRL